MDFFVNFNLKIGWMKFKKKFDIVINFFFEIYEKKRRILKIYRNGYFLIVNNFYIGEE